MIAKRKRERLQLHSRVLIDQANLLRMQQVNHKLLPTRLDHHWVSSIEPIAADAIEETAFDRHRGQLELDGAEGI